MHSDIWLTPQNILSFALLLVTLAYTLTSILTWLESRAVRKQKTAPLIIAFLKSNVSHDTLYLHIKNIGEGCARDVRAIPTQDYKIFGKDKHLSDFPLFSTGVNIFPPSYEITITLGFWKDIIKQTDPAVIIQLEYTGLRDDKQVTELFHLPFKQIATIYSTPPSSAEERIPFYLHEIEKGIAKLCEKYRI